MSTSLQSPCHGKTLEPIMTADSTLPKQERGRSDLTMARKRDAEQTRQ